MKITEQTREFMKEAGQECPEKPIIPDAKTRVLRLRLLLEEVFELADASALKIYHCDKDFLINFEDLEVMCSPEKAPNLTEIADALVDTEYVLQGAFLSYGLNEKPLFDAVHENNMTKFIDSTIDENGKVRKGPHYKAIDLTDLVNEQYN